jgi:hypothetical protein
MIKRIPMFIDKGLRNTLGAYIVVVLCFMLIGVFVLSGS